MESKSTVSLKDRAYAEIKHRIITFDLKPGQELSENDIAKLLNIGRTPVHQALDRLHTEGMVEVQPRKGVVVRGVSLDEVMDIVEVRLLNECFAVRLAAERASSAEIVAIRDVLQQSDEAVAANDVINVMLLDREFHQLIARAAHNAMLAEMLLKLHERLLRLWFISLAGPEHRANVQQQHHDIFNAISRRDAAAADAAMRSHIEDFHRIMMEKL